MAVLALDHVQLAIPEGGEDRARAFYAGLLGFREVDKPQSLAGRGGCWFEAGYARLHLGVEKDFRPALKAHPAILLDNLDIVCRILEGAGCRLQEDVGIAGYRRRHVFDPFGNRIELMQRLSGEMTGQTGDILQMWQTNGFAEPVRIEHRSELIMRHSDGLYDQAYNFMDYFFRDPHMGTEVRARSYEGDRDVVVFTRGLTLADYFLEDILCYLVPRFEKIKVLGNETAEGYEEPPEDLLRNAKARISSYLAANPTIAVL
ncbi:catechol 2,3-dioxygenase-like lactoylglutathione lyase family enzyme [Rhizobium aquaticum]|uniref:Catechol 2,3-dioxygenase-like lactoylglutathione lyase family enzyme n=1 Tax=Rhizobium aquaticum TaxID=1549636 RepID=A0ABV2J3C8_9HYPH